MLSGVKFSIPKASYDSNIKCEFPPVLTHYHGASFRSNRGNMPHFFMDKTNNQVCFLISFFSCDDELRNSIS